MVWCRPSQVQAKLRRWGMRGLSLLLLPWLIEAGISQAQVVPNPGDTGTIVTPNGNRFDITGGALSRDQLNLFHSFNQFGLSRDQIANFLSNPTLQNILVRVNGGNASVIDGLLRVSGGNSNLFFMNPAGIIFGGNARLDVPGSFTATTANGIGFGAGWFSAAGANDYAALVGSPSNFAFATQPGAIVNAGSLTVGPGQSLRLLGGTVVNTGDLTAPGGEVTIAAIPGDQVVRLSQPGDVLSLQIQTNGSSGTQPNAWTFPVAALPQLLTGAGVGVPTGLIATPDGSVQVAGKTIPTDAGTAIVSGTLNTSSPSLPNSSSSQVNVLGTQVGAIGATIDASGTIGGGLVRIGGDYQGKGAVPNALQTFVSADSAIKADALTSGNGGRVIVWADGKTEFLGSISARGGFQSGKGGFAEVSGKQNIFFDGIVNLNASNGSLGMLLLDSTDILISNGSDPKTTITQAAVEAQASNANVILEAVNNITVGTLTNNRLNLKEGNFSNKGTPIVFRADSDKHGIGVFSMNQGDTILLNGSGIEISGASVTTGTIISSGSGQISLTANNGNIITQDLNSNFGGQISLTATNGNIITQDLNSNSRYESGKIILSAADGYIITKNANSSAVTNYVNAEEVMFTARDGISTGTIKSESNAGQGGAISLTTNNGSITTDDLSSSGGKGGAITLTAARGSITTGKLNSSSQSAFQFYNAGTGGAISLSANGDIVTDDISSFSGNSSGAGNGGNITLLTDRGSIRTGELNSSHSTDSGARASGLYQADANVAGSINLSARSNITTGNINLSTRGSVINPRGQSSNSRVGSAVVLSTTRGDIVTGDIDSSGQPNLGDGVISVSGGAITLLAPSGNIKTGDLSSFSLFSDGGSIQLTAQSGITTRNITTTGGDGGTGNSGTGIPRTDGSAGSAGGAGGQVNLSGNYSAWREGNTGLPINKFTKASRT